MKSIVMPSDTGTSALQRLRGIMSGWKRENTKNACLGINHMTIYDLTNFYFYFYFYSPPRPTFLKSFMWPASSPDTF
jgi:hypothetical protein